LKAALHSQLLYQDRVRDRMRQAQGSVTRSDVPPSIFAAQHGLLGKISLANFSARITLSLGRIRPNSRIWRAEMAWKTPKIVEVPCGMEINMYVSATRK
jgi:coenzyme PQQ precursor peptide PqqA